jgi:hypothetical protein
LDRRYTYAYNYTRLLFVAQMPLRDVALMSGILLRMCVFFQNATLFVGYFASIVAQQS